MVHHRLGWNKKDKETRNRNTELKCKELQLQ